MPDNYITYLGTHDYNAVHLRAFRLGTEADDQEKAAQTHAG